MGYLLYFNQMPCDYTLKWCTFNQLPVTWHLLTVAKVDPALEFAGEIRPIFFIIFIYFSIFWPISRKRIGLPHLDYTFLESAQYFDFVGNKHGWMYTVIPYDTDVWNVQAQIWCNAFEVICPVRPHALIGYTVRHIHMCPVVPWTWRSSTDCGCIKSYDSFPWLSLNTDSERVLFIINTKILH